MKDRYIYIGFACIFTYMLPYLILGENAYITIHDFLDQNVVIMAMLKNTGLLTSISGIVPNMDGLDRSLFPVFTPFDVKMVSYLLLPTYWAIITYTFIYKIIAFLGMYLLLNSFVFKKDNNWVSLLLSLGFAFVPFYVELAISGAGFPLVLYAFLNLYNNTNKVWSYIAIVFYSFNSLLAYGGFFLLAILFCCLVLDYSRTKKFPKNVIIGAVIMSVVYLLANWGTLYSLFFSESFISHRTEWVNTNSLIIELKFFASILLFSHIHAGRCLAFPIILLFVYIYFKYRGKYHIISLAAILYGLIVLGVFVGIILRASHIQLFVTIQFDRFYFFYPTIVFILLGITCYVFIKENQKQLVLCLALFGLICGIYYDVEVRQNMKILAGQQIDKPTYKQFYDTELFDIIKKDLGIQSDYTTKTVSVGIFPCIAEYNAFWTLDSYRVNYPVEYKHRFRLVIGDELTKSEELRNYYDEWGSRCYVFSAELEKMNNQYYSRKTNPCSIKQLDINTKVLKELGCEYVLSSVDICNYRDLSLSLVNSYTTDKSYWNIRVYKID